MQFRRSPAGALLDFSVAPCGGSSEQVRVSRPDGTGRRVLAPGGRETNRLSGFPRDASRLLLASNDRSGATLDAYLLDRLMQRGDDDFLLVDLQSGAELLLFGANDTSCPVIEAEQVVEHLRTRGVLVEYVLFPDEGHGGRRIPDRVLSTVEGTRRCVRYLTERA